MKLFHIIPLLCLMVGLVLIILSLFGGNKRGFMEEYAILRVNMTSFGNNLFDIAPEESQDPSDKKNKGGIGDLLSGIASETKDKVEGKINKVGNSLANKLREELGIADWYSIHIQEFCQGSFKNNSAGFEVAGCIAFRPGNYINLTAILESDLSVGPLELSLVDLHWPPGIQSQVSKLNAALHVVFIFYVLAVALTGAAVVCNFALLFHSFTPFLVIAAAVLSGLAFVNIGLGSAVTTGIARAVAKAITGIGEQVGISAVPGRKFITLTWVAFVVVGVAAGYWANEFRRVKRTSSTSIKIQQPIVKNNMRPSQFAFPNSVRQATAFSSHGMTGACSH